MEQPAVWNKRGINFNNIQIVPEQKYVDTIQILQRWYTFTSDILCSTKNGLQFIKLWFLPQTYCSQPFLSLWRIWKFATLPLHLS